jgi:hypothetical protein
MATPDFCEGVYGGQCSFTCDPGYTPSGLHVCGSNRAFNGGSCEPNQCSDDTIRNSETVCTGSTGDTCVSARLPTFAKQLLLLLGCDRVRVFFRICVCRSMNVWKVFDGWEHMNAVLTESSQVAHAMASNARTGCRLRTVQTVTAVQLALRVAFTLPVIHARLSARLVTPQQERTSATMRVCFLVARASQICARVGWKLTTLQQLLAVAALVIPARTSVQLDTMLMVITRVELMARFLAGTVQEICALLAS